MANEYRPTYRGGMGFFSALGILFIALRLMGVIDWPWWVVLAPLWGPLAATLVILLVMLMVLGIARLLR